MNGHFKWYFFHGGERFTARLLACSAATILRVHQDLDLLENKSLPKSEEVLLMAVYESSDDLRKLNKY